MHRVKAVTLAVSVLALGVSLSGCLDAFAIKVDPAVLEGANPAWQLDKSLRSGGGWGEVSEVETVYRWAPEVDEPPFPGILQVFSFRGLEDNSRDELLDSADKIVARATTNNNIKLNPEANQSGERTLRNGLQTSWFVVEGRVQGDGQIFQQDVIVKIVAEVGHDGKSDTSLLAVGLAQIARITEAPGCNPPILPSCEDGIARQDDQQTWLSLVGDDSGSITGGINKNGLLWNLVTHD